MFVHLDPLFREPKLPPRTLNLIQLLLEFLPSPGCARLRNPYIGVARQSTPSSGDNRADPFARSVFSHFSLPSSNPHLKDLVRGLPSRQA